MLYTRKGDTGTSGLFGTKERLPKDAPIYEALGTLDELNSLVGLCRAFARLEMPSAAQTLYMVQERIFVVQAELAGAPKHLEIDAVPSLESEIETFEGLMRNSHSFVIPGETPLSALFDLARTVTRRAERRVTAIANVFPVRNTTKAYLNRLSSLMYALARASAHSAGAREKSPTYQ